MKQEKFVSLGVVFYFILSHRHDFLFLNSIEISFGGIFSTALYAILVEEYIKSLLLLRGFQEASLARKFFSSPWHSNKKNLS